MQIPQILDLELKKFNFLSYPFKILLTLQVIDQGSEQCTTMSLKTEQTCM